MQSIRRKKNGRINKLNTEALSKPNWLVEKTNTKITNDEE